MSESRRDDQDRFGVLPCAVNPAGWDIPAGETHADLLDIRHRVVDALHACNACSAQSQCERAAFDNPPEHECVQGGHIWPGVDSRKRLRAKGGVGDPKVPVPYERWAPVLMPFPGRRRAVAA